MGRVFGMASGEEGEEGEEEKDEVVGEDEQINEQRPYEPVRRRKR